MTSWKKIVYTPFQNVDRSSFVLNQTYLTLTKFIEKCTNICNIKSVFLDPSRSVFIVHLFGVLDVNIFFLKTWSKLEKVDLGSLNDLHFGKEGEPNKHKSTPEF